MINGQTYYYNITAHSLQGEGAHSATVSAMPLNVPSAPTSPLATPATGQMSLSWSPPYNDGGSSVSGYRIYRGTSSSLLLYLKDSTQTSATDTGLSNGQTYYYQISAVNAVGEGARCSVFSGILASPPGPLQDLQAVPSDSKVTLTWAVPTDNGGSPITGYTVCRSLVSGQETVLLTVTGTTYQDTNLVNGVTYYYQVMAVNAMGAGHVSNEISSVPAAVLGPPTSIAAAPSDSAISLSWTAPVNTGGSPAVSYKIYRGTSSTTQLFLVSVTQSSYLDTGLTNGQSYYYKISSVNAVGEGAQSATVSATPFSIPSSPLSLAALAGNGGVSLSWAAPLSNGGASILRYHVYWSESATGPWTMIDTLNTGLVYAHTGLTNGHTYYYQVAAVNVAGEGPRTPVVSATPRTVPSAPALISATGGTGNVTLVWTAPASDGGSPVTKYSVYRGISAGSEMPLRDAGTSLNFVDSSVSPGVTYYYMLTAWNSQGESLRSNEVVGTPFGVPSAPLSLTGSAADSSISLQWSAPASDGGSPVTAYKVFFGTASGIYSSNQTVSSLSFLHTSLTNGVRYYYAVSAISAVGSGPLSDEFSAVPMSNPSAPQSVTALPGVQQISLSWAVPLTNGGSNITGYKVYRGPTAMSQSLIAVLGPSLHYTDTQLSNGTVYHYSVVAINSKGDSLPSSDAYAKTSSVPAVPAAFTVAPGDSQASLFWSAPADNGGSAVTSFNVYRSTILGTYVRIANTASLSYSDPGLANGQQYYYSVAAVNAVGEGPMTSQASMVPVAVPGQPTQLSAAPGVKSVTLSWSAPASDGGSPVLGYHILRGIAPGLEAQYTDVGSRQYPDLSLNDGSTFYYQVVAYNALGDGAASAEAYATTFSLPGAPSFLHASVSDRQVSLQWSAPVSNGGSAILYYTVYRGDSSGSMSIQTSTSSTSFNDLGLTNGHFYYYAVSATNAVGEGPSAAPITAVPSMTPSVPLHLTSAGGVKLVSLSWSAPADNGGTAVTSYRIYRSLTEGGPYQPVAYVGSTTYTDAPLGNGVHYYYRVSAVNSAGEGAFAGTNTTTAPVPAAPTLQANLSGLAAHLSWSNSAGATSYQIYRGTAAGQESSFLSVTGNTYVDGPFAAGTTYYYYVTGVNVTGEGLPSNEVVAALVTVPSVPTNLVAMMSVGKTVLSWNAPTNSGGSPLRSYQVLRGLSHGTEALIGTSDSTTFNDTNMTTGQRYFYQVKATNVAGTSPASNEASIVYVDTFTAPHLTATAGLGIVTLAWGQPSMTNGNTLTGYNVYRGTASGSETLLIGVNVTGMVDTGVTVGVTYYYRISSVTTAEEGPLSNEVSATPFTYPGTPTAFTASGSDGSALLNWSAPLTDGYTPILGYHVLRGMDPGNLSQVAEVTQTGYKDTGAVSGNTYYYIIAAFNAAGDGNATPVQSVAVQAKADPPIGLTAIYADGKITLTWDPPTGVNVFTYSIYRGNESGGETYLVNCPTTKWVDTNVTGGKTYYYQVSATTLRGESQMSDEAKAAVLSSANQAAQPGALLDQMWFRIVIIMTILVIGFFSFVLFVRKGKVRVKRDR